MTFVTIVTLQLLSCVLSGEAAELIKNGNFEKGNRDFRSDYKEGPGAYIVTKNLRDFHHQTSGKVGLFGDHTSGRGYMLVVDGATTGSMVVWEQLVSVLPRSEYIFTLWLASWSPDSPAALEVSINGKELGRIEASSRVGEWRKIRAKWNSELESVAAIAIRDRNTDGQGNDFVIDDISLSGPRTFPVQIGPLVSEYEKDASAIRKEANAKLVELRKKLLSDLNQILEKVTKEGKLDEAIALRQKIAEISADTEVNYEPNDR